MHSPLQPTKRHPNIPQFPKKIRNQTLMRRWCMIFSCTIFSSKFDFKIRFKATGVSCIFRVPEKTIPVPPVASKTIAGKDFAPVIAVGRGMWFDLGRLLPQKHGQNLWLSCPLFWLLGPGIIKKTPYLSGPGPASYIVGGRPWAACSMDVFSKPF